MVIICYFPQSEKCRDSRYGTELTWHDVLSIKNLPFFFGNNRYPYCGKSLEFKYIFGCF